uniref:Uncharacterized protein n=1 Tax=virus sp. ctmTa7 TaxID=2828255 RepID=A0A8S5RCM3_9VIRU|nr:MAG TPA: hypothetical protein [virus sp. ctmTa7]
MVCNIYKIESVIGISRLDEYRRDYNDGVKNCI